MRGTSTASTSNSQMQNGRKSSRSGCAGAPGEADGRIRRGRLATERTAPPPLPSVVFPHPPPTRDPKLRKGVEGGTRVPGAGWGFPCVPWFPWPLPHCAHGKARSIGRATRTGGAVRRAAAPPPSPPLPSPLSPLPSPPHSMATAHCLLPQSPPSLPARTSPGPTRLPPMMQR